LSALLSVLLLGLLVPRVGVEAKQAVSDRARIEALLKQGVEMNFEGDFDAADRIWARFQEQYPEHPAGPSFAGSTLFWRQILEEGEEYDEPGLDRVFALANARLKNDPNDAEALMYRGQAHLQQAGVELDREQYMAAGSAAKKGRADLERALELDPELDDARYQLGIYYYYTGILPGLLKIFSWLWFIPKGDRELGLQYLHEAREQAPLFGNDAAFMLMNVNAYYEDNGNGEALKLAWELHSRYPRNSLFHNQLISVLSVAQRWNEVVEQSRKLKAGSGDYLFDEDMRTTAPLWRAYAELQLGQTQTAWETLSQFQGEEPREPRFAYAWLCVVRGNVLDMMGKREEAIAQYERALAVESSRTDPEVIAEAEEALKQAYQLEAPLAIGAASTTQ
jgi:tetratricopeptide (TPR) repeat protein